MGISFGAQKNGGIGFSVAGVHGDGVVQVLERYSKCKEQMLGMAAMVRM